MKNCIDEGTLQAWFDGELSAAVAASVTAHVNACAQCAEAARTLDAQNLMVSQALSAEFAQPVPTERLRQRVDAAVAGLNPRRAPAVNESRWVAVTTFLASFRPLAYASVAAVVLLAAFLGFVYLKRARVTAPAPPREARRESIPPLPAGTPEPTVAPIVHKPDKAGSPPRVPRRVIRNAGASEPALASVAKQEHKYQTTIAKLNETFQSKPPLRPSLRVEYEYNLALIDNAIAASRDVSRRNPKDPQAARFMLAAYQSKVDLMNQFDELRGLERLAP
jgi:hypothetical protein